MAAAVTTNCGPREEGSRALETLDGNRPLGGNR